MPKAAAPFFFQILLAGLKGAPSDVVDRSIVVEADPSMISGASLIGEKERLGVKPPKGRHAAGSVASL
jgi:hypothetical protein